MTDHPIPAPPSARRPGARTAGRPRPRAGGETGAVTAEYAVLLPVIAFVLVSVLLAGAAAVQQVRGQDAAATAARILARGDDEAAARDAVARMAGEAATLTHAVDGGWVRVDVVQPGPGPLAWAEALTLTAHAAAPEQRPGAPAAPPGDRS